MISALLLLTLLSYLIYWIPPSQFLLNLTKLLLGASFYFSVKLISSINKEWIDKTINILFYSYSVSLIVGILEYLDFNYGLGLGSFFEVIFARFYAERVQFTFTEPSFSSVHVFGVLLLLLLYRNQFDNLAKRLIFVGLSILALSLYTGASLRMFFDIGLVFLMLAIRYATFRLKYVLYVLAIISAVVFLLPDSLSERLTSLFDPSVDIDSSAAIRKFRIESAAYGWLNNAYTVLFGYGFGNSSTAMSYGFPTASTHLVASYNEVNELMDYHNDGLVYSMHFKMLAEFGLIGYTLILFSTFNKSLWLPWVIMFIVYLQFDSYVLYSFWIYLLMQNSPIHHNKVIE